MLEKTSGNPPRTTKKSRRSTSPRAIELRRTDVDQKTTGIKTESHSETTVCIHLTYCRKVQEINQARKQAESSAITEETDQETQDASNTNKHHSRGGSEQRLSNNDSTDNQASQPDASSSMTFYATLPRTGLLASECSNMIMAEDMMANQAQSVSWVDPMAKPMQESENYMPQSSMPPQNCTCSAATGPWIGHMEKMHTSSKPSSVINKGTSIPTISAVENTRRFGALLESISGAGFHNLDEMVLEYYSARFEPGSLPAMAQCASRSRRIKTTVQNLYEDSRQWPRWESRGLHESVSQATISLCLGEMERLKKAHTSQQLSQSDPGCLIVALERMLQSSAQGNPTILDELKLSENADAAVDEMPHLWSLLTELVGPRGLYCDRMAKIIMVILLYTRSA
ncbi:hypothetical protein N7536_010248 [Penicillium majusculum]|nr:hypothetical protein N7536_010248 [Penicillium majusculum]